MQTQKKNSSPRKVRTAGSAARSKPAAVAVSPSQGENADAKLSVQLAQTPTSVTIKLLAERSSAPRIEDHVRWGLNE